MAIAFDTADAIMNDFTGLTATQAHTSSGSDIVVLSYVLDNSNLVTGATYNGVAMTQLGVVTPSGVIKLRAFGLANAPAGSHNVVVTSSSSNTVRLGSVSYNGCSSTQPDAVTTNGPTSAASPFTTTLTTVAANCWTVLFADGVNAITAGTGSTFRLNDSGTDGRFTALYDSNGALSTGSHSMSVTHTGTSVNTAIMLSLAPFVASANNSGFFMATAF